MGRARLYALVVALGAVAVLVGSAAAGGQTLSGPSPFAGCVDTLAGNHVNAEVEPWLAVSPTDGRWIAAWQQDRWGDPAEGGAHGFVAFSSATSARSTVPFTTCSGGTAAGNGDFDRASDVWLSYGPDGVAYQVALVFDWNTGRNGITVSRSTNDGSTWSTPVVVDKSNRTSFTHGDDKESITADPFHAGVVYVVWDRYSSQNPAYSDGHGQNANKGPAYLSKSTDGGRTWSAPAAIYNQNNGTLGNQLVVLPNGSLADFFTEFVVTNVKGGVVWSERLSEIRSTDGGSTWTKPTVVSAMTPNGALDPVDGSYIRGGDSLFDVAVDSTSGTLYAVWQDSLFHGVDQVAFSRSTDGGATWSAPVQVSDASGSGLYAQAFCPSVDVASDGTVGITYYTFAAGGDDIRYVARTSATRGTSWSGDMTLASGASARNAPDAGGYMIGDYEALAHSGTTFLTAFEVTNNDPSNPTDIVFASFG